MKQKFWEKNRYSNMVLALLMILSIVIAVFVYMTGGTTKVYTHFMYIPIVIAASIYGKKKGLFIAVSCDCYWQVQMQYFWQIKMQSFYLYIYPGVFLPDLLL